MIAAINAAWPYLAWPLLAAVDFGLVLLIVKFIDQRSPLDRMEWDERVYDTEE